MKYVIVYWTRYGNNKKIVDYLANKLEGEAKVFRTGDIDPKNMPDADYYIFSAAAEGFRVQANMKNLMKALENMGGKKYGIINTHGLKRNWLKAMDKLLSKKGMVKVAEVDFRIEGAPQEGPGLPEGWEAELDRFCVRLA